MLFVFFRNCIRKINIYWGRRFKTFTRLQHAAFNNSSEETYNVAELNKETEDDFELYSNETASNSVSGLRKILGFSELTLNVSFW